MPLQGWQIIPVYILEDADAGTDKMGLQASLLASRLDNLNKALDEANHMKGPQNLLETLIGKSGVDAIYWNRCYEPWRIKKTQSWKSTFIHV